MKRLIGTLFFALSVVVPAFAFALPPAHSFGVQGDHFALDGKPFVIRAGELHYARVPHEYGRARMRMARAMGLNAITTYVFWNLHEPQPGNWNFSGDLDVAAFVRTAQEEGLYVILRPGPYICSEWDFGGYPAWLLKTPGLRVRSFDPRYMQAAGEYLKHIGAQLAPLSVARGGPIILVQVENEYGSFGADHEYVAAVRQQMIDAGFNDVQFYNADGPDRHMQDGGALPGMSAAMNFNGTPKDAEKAFAFFAKYRPDAPRMVGEYWTGWFDHWGERHHTSAAQNDAEVVDWLLARDISFNLYMFAGGTNFGYLAGANYDGKTPYQPDTTSYDYDAPLDEAGRPTPKFHALRAAIAKRLPPGETLPAIPPSSRTISIPRFELTESVALFDALPALSQPVHGDYPQTMEELGQNFGYVLYRHRIDKPASTALDIGEARDYVSMFADAKPLATLYRGAGQRKTAPLTFKQGQTLDLLVENMGRVNYGQELVGERKGLIHGVSLGDVELENWEMYTLPLNDLSALKFKRTTTPQAPAFWRGNFDIAQAADTFLDMRGWGHGQIWINGHHLGRYWKIGPQQSLYLPGAWLHPGSNEIIAFDVETNARHSVQGLADPVFETKKR